MGKARRCEVGNEKVDSRYTPKKTGANPQKAEFSNVYYGEDYQGMKLILHHNITNCKNFLDDECPINDLDYSDWFYEEVVSLTENFLKAHNLEDNIISKELLYRTVVTCSRENNFVMKSFYNNEIIDMNNVHLSLYLHIYLYTLIYPNIFADVKLNDGTRDKANSLLKKHTREIFLAEYLLERAIILDGFLDLINHNFIEIINNDDTYSIEDFFNEQENDYTGRVHQLYNINVEFIGKVYKEYSSKEEFCKTKKVILNHNFFLNRHKGEKKYKAMLGTLEKLKNSYDRYLADSNYTDMEKIFSLYHLNKLTHIFDFKYHNDFSNIDFHLTEGFATNFVLHYIISKNQAFLDNGYFDWFKNSEEEKMENNGCYLSSIPYTCSSASDLSIKDNLSVTDLAFIRNLIKKVSKTLNSYILKIPTSQISGFQDALNSFENDLIKFILYNIEIPSTLEPLDDRIGCYGLKYYKRIYDDLYSQYNIFFEQDDELE